MPTLNWNDVVELSTDEAKQAILNKLDLVGFDATSWQEGSIPLACLEIGAMVWSAGSKYAVFIKNLAFNATSIGEGLTRFSKSHYDNTRQSPVYAQRRITLTCAVGQGPYTLNVSDVLLQDAQAHTFRNVAGLFVVYPVTLSSGGSVTLLFEAEVAGAASSVAQNTVTTLVTTYVGVTVTSDLISQVGQDVEGDPKLQARNSSKWASLGFTLIRDGAENIALNEKGVTRVRIDDSNPRGQGTFDVYVAQPGATAASEQVASLQRAFDGRVFGVNTCRVIAAPELALDLAGVVYFDSRFAKADVETAVGAALAVFIAGVPLGGFDYSPGPTNIVSLSDIINAVKDATSSGQKCVRALTLAMPSADISVASFTALIAGDYTGLVYTATDA